MTLTSLTDVPVDNGSRIQPATINIYDETCWWLPSWVRWAIPVTIATAERDDGVVIGFTLTADQAEKLGQGLLARANEVRLRLASS